MWGGMGGEFLCPVLPFQHSKCLKFVRRYVAVAKPRPIVILCCFLLVVWMRVLENSREVVQSWSNVEKIYSQNFLLVIAAQEEKFELPEEILLLCGSTNVYGVILEIESLPAARALIVCNYKHKLLCLIEAPDFLVLLCKWNKIQSFQDYASCYFFICLNGSGSLLLKTSSHKHLCCKFILVCFFSCLLLFYEVVWILKIIATSFRAVSPCDHCGDVNSWQITRYNNSCIRKENFLIRELEV